MNNTYDLQNYADVLELVEKTCGDFLLAYEDFIEKFSKLNIQMTMKPCYFYNGKFHTKARKKGSSVFFRICLFPRQSSFAKAMKKHLAKEMFSHKIVEFAETSHGYHVKTSSSNDRILQCFLNGRLKKCMTLSERGKPIERSLTESLGDIFRSMFLMNRYRSNVKVTFYGFDLHWIILIIVIILILLESDAYYDFITS